MTTFIVHAKGFVREATAELLRARGIAVIEAPLPSEAVTHLTADPTAVLVCNEVPPVGGWAQGRRVILLDGVDDDGIQRLADGGALLGRPARGTADALLDAAHRTASGGEDAAIVALGPSRDRGRAVLTPRQLEVVNLIGRGLTSQEIADRLGVRPKTVENYKQRVFVRLGVQNQAHAVARCARLGLMDDALVLAS